MVKNKKLIFGKNGKEIQISILDCLNYIGEFIFYLQ
jgi:hypothetical protein